MGWEWHNRERGYHGHFALTQRTERIQMRVTRTMRDQIAARASVLEKDMTEYLIDLVREDLLRAKGYLP